MQLTIKGNEINGYAVVPVEDKSKELTERLRTYDAACKAADEIEKSHKAGVSSIFG